MERGLSPVPLTWRDVQQLLIALSRRSAAKGLMLARAAVQTIARLAAQISRKLVSQKSYPSHRACPACGESTVYRASWSTFFTGLYTRTCCACSYCEPRKVKMIRQL